MYSPVPSPDAHHVPVRRRAPTRWLTFVSPGGPCRVSRFAPAEDRHPAISGRVEIAHRCIVSRLALANPSPAKGAPRGRYVSRGVVKETRCREKSSRRMPPKSPAYSQAVRGCRAGVRVRSGRHRPGHREACRWTIQEQTRQCPANVVAIRSHGRLRPKIVVHGRPAKSGGLAGMNEEWLAGSHQSAARQGAMLDRRGRFRGVDHGDRYDLSLALVGSYGAPS